MGKRRILNDFVIDKIAAVDNPCQEHARVAIIKRKEDVMDQIAKKDHDDLIAKLNGDWQKKHDDLVKSVEKLTAENAESVAKAKMSDDEKECYDRMKDEDKKKFLVKSADERKAEVAKLKAGEETIVVSGVTIKKSATDPAVFEIMKAQQEQLDESKLAIEKSRDEAETARIEKRVSTEFLHVPGKPADLAKVFKAAAKMPIEVQTIFETVMKAAEQMAARGFEKIGLSIGEIRKGQEPFNAKVQEIMTVRKISKADAMVAAAQEHPDLYQAFQDAGTEAARRAA